MIKLEISGKMLHKHGSDITAHVHWTPHDRGVAEGTHTVAWKIDYSWASIGDTFLPSATVDLTDACQSINDHHLMTPNVTITGTGKGISSMIVGRLYRDTGDGWSGTGANAPILLEIDFHFQVDSTGSRTNGVK